MFQPVFSESDTTSHIIWQHKWSDGSRLELSETPDNFVLIEYDPDNNPIPYMVETGYTSFPSIEERYPKRRWKYRNVLEDIKEEYDLDN